jgi:hypothetical protein
MNSPRPGRFNRFQVTRNAARRVWKRIVPAFAFKFSDSATRHNIIPARGADSRSQPDDPLWKCAEQPARNRHRPCGVVKKTVRLIVRADEQFG